MKSKDSHFPKLINDTPATADKLGAHKRIANTLCEIVRSNQGGKTIALEGEWGSGKSTVINLMTDTFEMDNDYKVVVYDAWVHAGDPLRRAYLSSLIDSLLEKKWLDDFKYWNDKKERLARRIKDSDKKTTPTFTTFGKWLLLLMLLVPLASVVFSGLYMSIAKNGFESKDITLRMELGLLVSGFFALFPFFIVTWKAIHARGHGENSDDNFALILNKSTVTERTYTIETSDPTTIEFQEVFNEVVTHALKNSARQLVLVIDNLDRLSSDEAELIWSMLRSFIDNPAFKNFQWKERLWVVVPIASNNWTSSEATNITASNDKSNEVVKDQKENIGKEKFLEKVFQVRLTLPPPVLADWKDYLLDLLAKAFGAQEKEHFSNIHRIFEAYIQDAYDGDRISPTPRELVLFTNELVTMKIQWEDKFSIAYLAAYILSTRKINVLRALQKMEIPSSRILRLLNTADVTKEFAAIYFNVENAVRAQQLLLRPLTESALMKGEEHELLNHLRADKGFEHVLDAVISESLGEWALEKPELFFNALIALSCIENPRKSNLDNAEQHNQKSQGFEIPGDTRKLVTDQGIAAIDKFPALPMVVENCAKGIISFLELIKDQQVEEAVIRSLRRMNKLTDANKSVENKIVPNKENIDKWLEELKVLAKHDRIAALLPTEHMEPIALPINQELWALFCYEFENDNKVLFAFTPSLGMGAIERYIWADCIKTLKFSWEHFSVIKRESELSNNTFLESIFKLIDAQLFANASLTPVFIESLLWTVLYLVNKNAPYKVALANIVNSGWLHHHLHAMVSQNEPGSAAVLVLSILTARPNATLPVAVGNAAAGQAIITQIMTTPSAVVPICDKIISDVKELSLHRLIIDISLNTTGTSGFVSYVIGKLGDLEAVYTQFTLTNTDDFAKEVDAYVNCAHTSETEKNKEKRKIVNFSIQKLNLLDIISKEPTRVMKNDWLYSIALSEGGIDNKNYVEKCIDLLKAIDQTSWSSKISVLTWTVLLVNKLLDQGKEINISEPLRGAMLDLAKRAAKDDPLITIETKYLSALVNSLLEVHKHGFAADVFDIVKQPDATVAARFWEKFGFSVSAEVQLHYKKVRTVRHVVKPMIARGDIAGLKWFANLLKEVGIERIDEEKLDIADFIEAANLFINNPSTQAEMKEILKSILELLGKPYKPAATEPAAK